MTPISGAELTLFLMMALTSAAGNGVLYFKEAKKAKQKGWAFYGYGSALILLACGWLTPPDLLSTLLFSVPLVVVLSIVGRRLNIQFNTKLKN